MARRDQTIYRDTSDAKIAGVCSGIAQYLDVDTTLVRIMFAALALAGGGGALAYAILWFVLDPAPDDRNLPAPEPKVVIDTTATASPIDAPPTSMGEVLHEGSHPEPQSTD